MPSNSPAVVAAIHHLRMSSSSGLPELTPSSPDWLETESPHSLSASALDRVDDALLGHRGVAAVEEAEAVLAVVAVVPVDGGGAVLRGSGGDGSGEVGAVPVVGGVGRRLVDRAVLAD